MKHVWKLLAVILCLALAVTAFVACGGEDETSADGTTDPIADTTADPSGTSADTSADTSAGTTDTSEPTDSSDVTVTTDGPTVDVEPCKTHTPSEGGNYCTVCATILKQDEGDYMNSVYFACDNRDLTDAYKVAIQDTIGNVKFYKGGLLAKNEKVIIAGAGYDSPWTRDASINVWNAFCYLDREVSKNTLYSVLKKTGTRYYIDGQYWDAMIWSIGAYQYYMVTKDQEFLKIAQDAVKNSLAKFEREEFDKTDNLFRGGAVYADGIAAYPDKYATNIGTPGIESWLDHHRDQAAKVGVGLPMKALSTNCVYYQSYVILAEMNKLLGIDASDALKKAENMKTAINKAFWNETKGTYDYFAYECDYQEAIGVAFVLMFGIADERQRALVLENTFVTEQGIACVYPSFDRYLVLGGYGRHAGTVWPHAQGFWARACSMFGYEYGYEFELFALAEKAVRDGQFWEIYHPDTGENYGGLQGTGNGDISQWGAAPHQTWSATAYMSLIFHEMLGTEIGADTVSFKPYLPTGINEATIGGFKVGNTTFDIVITRGGDGPSVATYNTTEEGTVRVHLSVA